MNSQIMWEASSKTWDDRNRTIGGCAVRFIHGHLERVQEKRLSKAVARAAPGRYTALDDFCKGVHFGPPFIWPMVSCDRDALKNSLEAARL